LLSLVNAVLFSLERDVGMMDTAAAASMEEEGAAADVVV
jgi:hypothetical protein